MKDDASNTLIYIIIMEVTELPDKTQELQLITEVLLDKSQRDSPEALESLTSLFDLLLWAQKRSFSTLNKALHCQLLPILVEKYNHKVQLLVSGFVLLLGNAKEDGVLSHHLLQHQLPDRVLRLYLQQLAKEGQEEEEQELHRLGSFLKAYHRHLTEKTVEWIVRDGQCLLVSLCCRFFNCPEEITRTSIMNILMTVLKLPLAHTLLSFPKVKLQLHRWSLEMCRLLRNQLKDFDQNLLTTEQAESEYIIHHINDKICLWEDLSALSEPLFAQVFHEEIVVPLVIGSLNTTGIPLFTLKFALFILNKLIKTLKNLDLLTELGQLLFLNQTITYKDAQLGTASLRPFSLRRLGEPFEEGNGEQDWELNEFSQVNLLFFNILRTKDSRFLQCGCTLLLNLLAEVRRSPQSALRYAKQLGLGINGANTIAVSEILIKQLSAIHSLQINRLVCCLLVQLQPSRHLPEDARYRFLHLYRTHLDDALRAIDRQRSHFEYLCQVFEYDVKMVSSAAFGMGHENLLLKTDAALIFNNQLIQNEAQPFYRQIPETDAHLLRYGLVKALLLRRLAAATVEECAGERSLERWLERVRTQDGRMVRAGEYMKLPVSCNTYRCKLVDQKIEIPNCLMLEEDGSLIVGFLEDIKVKIIINIKLKHITPNFWTKKDKVYVDFQIRKYDHTSQDIIALKGLTLKGLEVGVEYFKVKKGRLTEREAASIIEILRNAKAAIPEVSLI